MDVKTAIYTRRSIRKYKDEPVSRELIEEVCQAGRCAPSGGNNQTSRIYVVTNKDMLERMIKTAEQEFAKMEIYDGMYKSLRSSITRSKNGGYVYTHGAPVNIFITNKKGYGNAMADTTMALMNMMLRAHELGLGTCYTNQTHWLDENTAFRALIAEMGVTDEETVCCGMSLGWPDQDPGQLDRFGNEIIYID